MLKRLKRALTGNRAATDPGDWDSRLRGRTYAIPFQRVWEAAVELADGGQRGWALTRADDQSGVIEAEATTLVFRFVDDVRIDIGLDENGQTRVDMTSASRVGRSDLGANTRRIGRFFKRLDRALGAGPDQVLDRRVELRYEG